LTISNKPISDKSWQHWIAAGFGSGWLPKAPGTWGSLVSLPPAWFIVQWVGASGLMIASLLVLLIGCLLCAHILPSLSNKDPSWIVIDEWAGQWLCLALLIPFIDSGMMAIVLAFAAFRLFDIVKPWPVSLAEELGAGWWSIMADDVVAGVMGAVVIIIAVQWL